YYDSVRSGLLYQPTTTQSYYVSYGTSFDPSLEYLTATAGQQNLPPVENHSYEVGAKWDLLGGGLSVTSALFQIKQENARAQTSTGVYELVGTERVNGAEVTFTGHLTPKWQVFGGYTYLDPKIVSAAALDGTQGKTLSNTPRDNATLWTSYSVTPSWDTGTGLVYVSPRFATNTDTVQVPSYIRWDGMVAYHQPKYEIRLNLLNITNEHYFDSLIQSDAGRSVPGASRTALVSVAYKF
ncbi:MAG: TonB-dependent receptor, partial [Nevskiales bacterium]